MFKIAEGDALTIQVKQAEPAFQSRTIKDAYSALKGEQASHGLREVAALRGLNSSDYAIVGGWERPKEQGASSAYTPAISVSDCYEVLTVDRLDDSIGSILDEDVKQFVFVNVFQCIPEKRKEMITYFNNTIQTVRIQPGYIATNFMMSVDSRQAANIGIYESKETFLAIFRQREVLWDFFRGAFSGILPMTLGLLPKAPRLRLYELVRTDVLTG